MNALTSFQYVPYVKECTTLKTNFCLIRTCYFFYVKKKILSEILITDKLNEITIP